MIETTAGARTMVDPKMPTDPVTPSYARGSNTIHLIAAEVWDHLWPWTKAGFKRHRAMQAFSLAVALGASLMWVLAVGGEMRPSAVIGAWFGWSVFEVFVRMDCKRYVKDGPWWGRRYRAANLMDMISYVGFKNLLIGAILFIALKSQGLLVL